MLQPTYISQVFTKLSRWKNALQWFYFGFCECFHLIFFKYFDKIIVSLKRCLISSILSVSFETYETSQHLWYEYVMTRVFLYVDFQKTYHSKAPWNRLVFSCSMDASYIISVILLLVFYAYFISQYSWMTSDTVYRHYAWTYSIYLMKIPPTVDFWLQRCLFFRL